MKKILTYRKASIKPPGSLFVKICFRGGGLIDALRYVLFLVFELWLFEGPKKSQNRTICAGRQHFGVIFFERRFAPLNRSSNSLLKNGMVCYVLIYRS